ncbi:hypothetical protein KY318_04025, partial [Candidatus Woesearchaeota archaeon]|nr:hypothetical protein [Candidatus Woesearchaeota archaeon]
NKTTEETTTTIKGAGEGIAIPRAFSIKFENACNETCQLRINASSLKLRIAIIGEGDLFIDRVRYKFSKITEVVAPELIKEIPDIIIEQNRSFSLILSDYFKGSNLSYSYDSVANIDVKISNGKIFFVPERGFIGSVSTKVYAMNQLGSVESNRFSIRVKSFKGEELLTKLKRVFPSLAFIEITQANKIYTIVYRINDTIVRIRGLENVSSLKNISVGEVNEVVIG